MTKLLKATAIALIMSASASMAQVVEYDVPYESKWQPKPQAPVVKQCRLLWVLPCHEGFEYSEPGGDNLVSKEPEPQPEPEPKCK